MTSAPTGLITIIETGVANTASVAAAFARLGLESRLTRDPQEVADGERVVLPGVGAFGAGMELLRTADLVEPLRDRVARDRPTLAVCLGLQMLCRSSEESPGVAGLGIVNADVVSFPPGTRVPQFGWNRVTPCEPNGMIRSGFAYFANSYRLASTPIGWRGALADHNGPFVAAIERGRTLACQFHPELSARWGSDLLEGWLDRTRERVAC